MKRLACISMFAFACSNPNTLKNANSIKVETPGMAVPESAPPQQDGKDLDELYRDYSPPQSENEAITPPGNVSGSFLTCSVLNYASPSNLTAKAGCRFTDSDGKRVAAEKVAEDVSFSAFPPEGVSVTIQPNPNADWDIIFSFKAANPDSLNAAIPDIEIAVDLQNPANGGGDSFLKVQLKTVDYPLESWAPACKDNQCAFREVSTGRLWARSSDRPSDLRSAIATCEALEFAGYSDWRLPSQTEVQRANANQINLLAARNRLSLHIGKSYWTNTLSGQNSPDAWTINWKDGSMLPLSKTKSTPLSICIR